MSPDLVETPAALHAHLRRRGWTVASAESLTGGALGDVLSGAPGSSETYVGGVISYATEVKQRLLGVDDAVVREQGVVSAACAEQMARGVRDLLDADVAVSTTGVAGPTEQEGKPVGLVYIGIAGPGGVHAVELHLDGDRAAVRAAAVSFAVSELVRTLGVWTDEDSVGGEQ
ncbi:MAG: CinA family protein [Nocardioidaceae bacterium]